MNKILLYTCCAPCALPILDYFKNTSEIFNVSLYFFNPNIFSFEEYSRRLDYVKRIGNIYGVSILEGEYDHKKWLDYLAENLTDNLANYLENGLRCQFCFKFRLEETIIYAKNNGFDSFCSTLQTNLYKDTYYIISEIIRLCDKYGLKFINIPLDKKEVYKRGIELCKEFDIYRQKFCGCEFSANML